MIASSYRKIAFKKATISLTAVFFLVLVLVLGPTIATALTPTPQQIQALQSLPESEQRRLAAQLGIDFDSVSTGESSQPTYVATDSVQPRIADEDSNERSSHSVLPLSAQQSKSSLNGDGDGDGDGKQGFLTETDANDSEGDDLVKDDGLEEVPAELKLFGYDLFAGVPSTFAPVSDIPVSSNYLIGPGDSIIVQFYGKESTRYELAVDREGSIAFPEIGPLTVSGMNFSELKQHIQKVVSEQMIGVKATVTMGALRAIRVFVLGDAYRPGSYTVSSLSTMTNALFASGGITEVGSLRRIQLKRRGKVVGEFDLYDLLLKGDTRDDQRLLPGDVIFIPTIGKTVGVAGEVKRPAIYELKNEESVSEIVSLAGGFLPTAFPSASKIERIDARGNRTVMDIDLSSSSAGAIGVRDADTIHVFSVLDTLEDVVLLSGHVNRPGGFAWREGMRVTDLVPTVSSLQANPDLNYALIKRELKPTREIKLLKVDLNLAIRMPKSNANIALQSNDELFVFGLGEHRKDYIDELNEQLRFQTTLGNYPKTAVILGNVYEPGEYPIHQDMTYGDLLEAALSTKPETDFKQAVLAHRSSKKGTLSVELIALNKTSLSREVQPGDQLFVFDFVENRAETLALVTAQLELQSSLEVAPQLVSVTGFVESPGQYPLTFGVTVGELVELSGGFTQEAFPLSAEITRYELDERKHQITRRISLDLTTAENGLDTILQSRDQLYIKQTPNWNERKSVTISGEVNFPGDYPIYRGDTITVLLERAGGLTEYAQPEASVFLRESLREREQQQLDRFRKRLERDVKGLEIAESQDLTGKQSSKSFGNQLLDKLDTSEAIGRLVINLPAIIESSSLQGSSGSAFNNDSADIKLKDLDRLIIPAKNPEVTVLGEVQFPTSHVYKKGDDVFDYIESSGGYNSRSDDKRIYVIKANGRVAAVKNGWFSDKNTRIGAGDTIVVPYDLYSVGPMTYWSNVSQVLFQLATTVAALNTVGIF